MRITQLFEAAKSKYKVQQYTFVVKGWAGLEDFNVAHFDLEVGFIISDDDYNLIPEVVSLKAASKVEIMDDDGHEVLKTKPVGFDVKKLPGYSDKILFTRSFEDKLDKEFDKVLAQRKREQDDDAADYYFSTRS